MRGRTWLAVAVALGALLALLTLSLMAARSRAQEIYAHLDEVNRHHRQVDATLRRLRSDVNLAGIYIRDYLLDTTQSAGPEYRTSIAQTRASTDAYLAQLAKLVGERERSRVEGLASSIDEYWAVFEPIFDWTPAEKSARSLTFVRKDVLPRRLAVLQIAREIEEFNDANMRDQRAEVALRGQELEQHLSRILWSSVAIGALFALVAVLRLRWLEGRSREQHSRTEEAEAEMRRLSHELVRAQEDERRRLARELHDEVGQMLTALRMELGKAERARASGGQAFAETMGEAKGIVDTIMETVRALSMGLRPAMLDDFGLGAALEWHVRDFARRYDVPVFLSVEGDVDRLPEPHRTSVYRIVQEALTNCARHARARRVEVVVREGGEGLTLTIQDDGVGVDSGEGRRSGVGLVGIEERVREVGGRMAIHSAAGQGTTLQIAIPVQWQEEPLESPAG